MPKPTKETTKKPLKKKQVPLGRPLPLTDEDLDRLSQVTEADIAAAQALWRARAPQKFKNLLDAEPIQDEE